MTEITPDAEIALLRRRVAELEQQLRLTQQREGKPLSAREGRKHPLCASELEACAVAARLPGGAAFVVDHTLTYTLAGGESLASAGLTAASFVGRRLEEVMPPHLLEQARQDYQRALQGGTFLREHELQGRAYLTRGVPLRNESGQVWAALAISYDVTEQKRMETQLRAMQARLQAVIEQMPSGLFIVEAPSGRIVAHNAEAERILGHPAIPSEDYHGYQSYGAVHADGRPYEAQEYPTARALLTGEVVLQHDMLYQRPDGTLAHLSVNAAPVKQGDKTLAAVCTFHDITTQKQLELALQESQERLAMALDSAELGSWEYDVETGVNTWDERVPVLMGIPPEQAVTAAQRWLEFVHPEDRDWVAQAFAMGLSEGKPYEVDFRIRRPDGSECWLTSRGRLVADSAGQGKVIGVVQNITTRKLTEERLRRSNEDLERFAYMASHDLQEPLRMITSYSQLLSRRYRGQLDEQAENYFRLVLEGTQRMGLLIRDLLFYARSASGESLHMVPVDANTALQIALANLQGRLEEVKPALTWDHLPIVPAVEGLLAQVFQNLIGNALKYTQPGVPPEVHIGAERHENEWVFSVRDNGPGIAPEHQHQVFGLFTRLHDQSVSGSGIGLATCKRIIERHGGHIWVESTPGQGATFLFTLPTS